MAQGKKKLKNSTITKNGSKKREIKVYTRKKHIGNLEVLSRRCPVRFEGRKKSVLRMLESKGRNSSSPDEVNMRLRGCRHGTPYRQISPNDGEADQTEASDNGNMESMLHQIVELQLTAARLQGQNSLSKIVHKALDYGIQNGIIINGNGPRRGKGRWSNTSSHSSISVTSQRRKDSGTNTATVSAWGGHSFFRVGEVIGKLLTYLKHPITLSVKKSTVYEDASTQCSLCDVSIPQSDMNMYGPDRRPMTNPVNEVYKKNDPALPTYNRDWNCSEKCSTHVSLDTTAVNSSTCSENNSFMNSSCSPVNANVNIPADYMRPNQPPAINNNRPITSNHCFNSNMPNKMENYDLYNFDQCVNTTKEEGRL